MRRILILVAAAFALFVVVAHPASAQPTLDEVVQAVRDDGVFVERGADADEDNVVAALGDATDIGVVVLAEDDPDGAEFAAGQVRDELGTDVVILVISPGEIAVSESDFFSDAELGSALDEALDAFDDGGSTADAVGAFAASLDGDGATTGERPLPDLDGDDGAEEAATTQSAADDNAGSGGGGIGGFLVFLLVVGGLIGGFIWWAKRKANKVDTGEVERARAEIRSQLEVVAHDIVEHEHEIDLSGNEDAIAHYRDAGATYNRVSETVDATENLLELAELNDDIDHARWQLEAALAMAEGRPVPPEPEPEKPSACFFDPTHKPGTEEATLKTSAGDKEVLVCERCADQLERGERPDPRMIDVGGKRVPAAKAPRSHGGLGMGGLSIFEVILGGLGALTAARGRQSSGGRSRRATGQSVGLDWGDMLPSRRSTGSVFGPDRQPSRPRGLPRTRASRPQRSSSGGSRTRSRSRSRGGSRTRSRRR